MENETIELNLDEWVFLPDNKSSLLEFSHDGKDDFFKDSFFYPEGIIYMNYIDNYHSTDKLEENSSPTNETNQVLAPTLTEPDVDKNPDDILAKEFKDIAVVLPEIEFAQDIVSKIFYKRMMEPEFFDIEIEPQPIQLEEEEEAYNLPQKYSDSEIKGIGCNLWRWGRRSIGALCSIGVAAATLSILVLGGQQQKNKNQRIYFQIYTDDKRMKQVVQQASRLNQAMSALRGAPVMTAAQISFGGFYDGF
ncbi:uncharacterized protein [Typha angustifolia]|uniref:uncharacterized protein n=1 Tax=Typha angustifolia TaxID=59011 RepID=UPI003C300653